MIVTTKDVLIDEFECATEAEYAAFTQKKITSVRQERSLGRGPPWVRIGKRIVYPKAAMLEWLRKRTVVPGATATPTLIDSKPRRRKSAGRAK